MNFGSNCAEARRKKNMSQEELAEALAVSRQTVCKWETGVTYPDIDKLCEIAACLGVSTSYLLGEEAAAQPAFEQAPTTSPEEKAAVLRHFCRFSHMIGGATLLILLSVATSLPLFNMSAAWAPVLGLTVLLGGIFAAVICYVVAGIRHDGFLKQASPTLSFDGTELQREQRSFTVKIAVGLGLIFLGVLLVVLCAFAENEALTLLTVSMMLALIGIACHLFIVAGIRHDLYTEPQKALDAKGHRKKQAKPEDAIGGVIMSLATVVFFVLGFGLGLWHPGWIAFPIGGILCGCLSSLLKLGRGKSDEQEDD